MYACVYASRNCEDRRFSRLSFYVLNYRKLRTKPIILYNAEWLNTRSVDAMTTIAKYEKGSEMQLLRLQYPIICRTHIAPLLSTLEFVPTLFISLSLFILCLVRTHHLLLHA